MVAPEGRLENCQSKYLITQQPRHIWRKYIPGMASTQQACYWISPEPELAEAMGQMRGTIDFRRPNHTIQKESRLEVEAVEAAMAVEEAMVGML